MIPCSNNILNDCFNFKIASKNNKNYEASFSSLSTGCVSTPTSSSGILSDDSQESFNFGFRPAPGRRRRGATLAAVSARTYDNNNNCSTSYHSVLTAGRQNFVSTHNRFEPLDDGEAMTNTDI